jgi:hypothetical protein
MRELGLPFWLAGGTGSPEALRRRSMPAPPGSRSARCSPTATSPAWSRRPSARSCAQRRSGDVDVLTDPARRRPASRSRSCSSSTRTRRRSSTRRASACATSATCAPLPPRRWPARLPLRGRAGGHVREEGRRIEDTVGRKCLCNALMADIGHGQVRAGGELERPLLTSGDDLSSGGRSRDGAAASDRSRLQPIAGPGSFRRGAPASSSNRPSPTVFRGRGSTATAHDGSARPPAECGILRGLTPPFLTRILWRLERPPVVTSTLSRGEMSEPGSSSFPIFSQFPMHEQPEEPGPRSSGTATRGACPAGSALR